MGTEKETKNIIALDRIAPYVRYVNYKIFDGGTLLPERIIYDHEFIYCLSGEACFLYAGETYTVKKGELFYICPRLHNTMIVPEGKTFRVHCVHFDWISPEARYDFRAEQVYLHKENLPAHAEAPDPLSGKTFETNNLSQNTLPPIKEERLLERPNPEVDPALFPPLITGLDYDTTAPLFKELYQSYSQLGIGARLRERALFLQLAAEVCGLTSPSRDSCGLFHQKTISEAVNYIQEYYTEDISLPLLAAHSGLSPKYFGRLFREQTGFTVREYLTGIRIRNAKNLLAHTDSPLEQIASGTGFQDKFYFTKVFKRLTGITPGKYRKAYGHLDEMKQGEQAFFW